MVVVRQSPPERLYDKVGDRGAYAMSYDELFDLDARTKIEIRLEDCYYETSASTWREYGVVKHRTEEETLVYLPIEYFTKHGIQKTV